MCTSFVRVILPISGNFVLIHGAFLLLIAVRFCKEICPWVASFNLQVVQIPTYAQVGGLGLDIDRCIRLLSIDEPVSGTRTQN